MKKIALISAMLASAAFTTTANAGAACGNFNGSYIGIGPSYSSMQGRMFINTIQTNGADMPDSARLSSSTGGGILYVGYGQQSVPSNFYWGVEAVGKLARNTVEIKSTADVAGNGYRSRLRNNGAIGGALRLGHVKNGTLFFVSIGADWSRFKYRYTDLSANQSNWYFPKKLDKVSVVPGVGVETQVGKILVRGQVSLASYGTMKVEPFTRGAVVSYSNVALKIKPRFTTVSISAAYKW